jgi:fatty-acyl-CoA synthase
MMSMTAIASLNDILAIETTPLSQQNLAENTYEVFRRGAKRYGDNVALRFLFAGTIDEKSFDYSYNDLYERITQTANAFFHYGIQKEDVVSLLLPNLPQSHFVLWGAEAAGIANPINPMLEPEQIIEIMNAAKTKILVTLAPFSNMNLWEKAQAIAEKVPSLKMILTVSIQQFLPNVIPVAAVLSQRVNDRVTWADFDAAILEQNGVALDNERVIQADDIACYFHTGGTTGTPKLAVQSHGNQVFSAWMVGQELHWDDSEVVHCGLPLFHVNAPLISGLGPFSVGALVLLTSPQGFRSETVIQQFWQLVEKYQISFFMAVPTVYLALHQTWKPEVNTQSLKVVACGAAPMPTSLLKEFQDRTKIAVVEGYGLTEGTVFSSVNPVFGEKRIGSVGLRIPYQAMRVMQLNDKGEYVRDCHLNEVGSIVIKGPNVFQGYLRESDNDNIWVGDGWLNTGDLGRQDEQGYFWITGRRKDLIIRGGHNIDPQVIEEVLTRHPAVALAAAVGKPDLKVGELPTAYITLRAGEVVSEDALLEFVTANISERAAIPKCIHIIDKMPVTAVGKIYKPALRMDAIARVFQEALTPLKELGVNVNVSVLQDVYHGQKALVAMQKENYSIELECRIQELLKGYSTVVETISV